MNYWESHTQVAVRFRRFDRKRYAAFRSMHKVINIGVVTASTLLFALPDTAQAQKTIEPNRTGEDIYLGYPNYCSTMPMAVYTFLEHYDFTGKTIHPFCTHEGSGLSDTENDIRKAAHGAAVTKGLAIHGSHVDEAKSALTQWVEEFAK